MIKKQLGFSLIELSISLILSYIVIIIVFQHYISTQKTIMKLEDEILLKQKADLIKSYLNKDIQAVGYRGYRSCESSLLDLNHIEILKNLTNQQQKIFAIKSHLTNKANIFPQKIINKIDQQKIKYNTDILFLKDIPIKIYKISTPIQKPIHQSSFLAIADHSKIERFIAKDHKKIILSNTYQQEAELIEMQWVVYYLADSILYRDSLLENADSITDGIDDFYVNCTGKHQITSVTIHILLKSNYNIFGNQIISWRGKKQSFTDGYLRLPLEFTVTLRNVC